MTSDDSAIKFNSISELDDIVHKENVLQSANLLKAEAVEQHPLARSSSDSSSSSLEFESSNGSFATSFNSRKARTGKVASVGRLKDFLTKSDDSAKVDSSEGNSYYNIWQNKTKILTNLKKQATESVRSFTHSASHDNGFSQGFLYKTNNTPVVTTSTDEITENQQDTEVGSLLQSFKDNLSDPLSVVKQKEDGSEFLDDNVVVADIRVRSFSSSAATSTQKDAKKRSELPRSCYKSGVNTNISSAKKNVLAVSLSSLMAGKSEEPGDDEDINLSVEMKENVHHKESYSRTNETFFEISKTQEKPSEIASYPDNPPSLFLVFFLSLLLYLYFVLPVPLSIRIACSCFIFGCFFTTAVLCIVTPKSSRPCAFLPKPINSCKPYHIPLSIYDPDQPIKGWMNELYSYDPDTYHISNTHSVYLTLDGAILRLQTPQKSITRRSIYNEGSIPITNVVHQRIFDITHAKVYLQPPGLVKKRVWSKKYPVCIKISCDNSIGDSKIPNTEHVIDESKSAKDVRVLYLFGRTDRQKEEWFYRIQRSINLAFSRYNKKMKTSKIKIPETGLHSFGSEDEWGIIDDHYKEDLYITSNVCDITKANSQPIRMLQDYFVHMSRLFPQPNQTPGPSKSTLVKDSEESIESSLSNEHQVSWLNVVLGRVVFDFLRQQVWIKWLFAKVQKKLDKIKLPYFINGLKLAEMNLGSCVPLVHEISLPKLDAQGVWFEAEITYNGSAQMTLETKLVLTKLGRNETALLERCNYNRTDAVTDSDAEDSAESSDEEQESAVSRFVGQVQSAVSKIDGQQLFKDALKAVGGDAPDASVFGSSPPTSNPLTSPTSGAPPKKWMRIVDSIAKSKYFQKAADSEFVRKKLETVSNTPMLLSVELLQLKGTLVINIPPPPTDRVWYGFREPPLMQLKAHPKVGERVVKTTHVTDWIENKLQQEITKLLVMPNMDDIPIPIMFHNREQT